MKQKQYIAWFNERDDQDVLTDNDGKVILFNSEEEMKFVLMQLGKRHISSWMALEVVPLYVGTRRKFMNWKKATA